MYNKIFSKILDSSIWLEPDATRLVWITCLAAMDEDGFCAFASPANLARRANVKLPACVAALATLEGPDENSSDPDNEGRRLERVPGGWMVLNAEKYKEIVTREIAKQSNRERVSRFRSKVGGQANWNAIRAEILQKNTVCVYCKEAVATEVDHIVPLSKGGTNDRENLAPACRPCNVKKGSRNPMKWSCNGLAKKEMQSGSRSTSRSDTKIPPTPHADARGDAPRRITRPERQHAEKVLALRFGKCKHDPACENRKACIEAIAREKG